MNLKNKIFFFLKKHCTNVNEINKSIRLDESIKIKGSSIFNKVQIERNTKVLFSAINSNSKIGKNNKIINSTLQGNICTKENCNINKASLSGNVEVGRFSSIWGPNIVIESGSNKVSIGNFCSIARGVSIQAFNHNYKKITTFFIGQNVFNENWDNERVSKGNIVIENDVWIGANVIILGGVIIQNGAVIAANSVVTTDVDAYSIVAGTPAKFISYRFDKLKISKIQNLEWWNWSIEKIKANKHLFTEDLTSTNIDKIIDNE